MWRGGSADIQATCQCLDPTGKARTWVLRGFSPACCTGMLKSISFFVVPVAGSFGLLALERIAALHS